MSTRVVKAAIITSIAVLPVATPPAAVAKRAIGPDPPAYVAPSRNFDTIHTKLDVDLDLKNRTIAGTVTHHIRILRPGVTSIRLNCVGLTIESVTLSGQAAHFEYPVAGNTATSWIDVAETKQSTDQLVIYSESPLGLGDEFDVMVAYHGSPVEGLYFIQPEKGLPEKRYEVWAQGEGEDTRYWIPCYDYPNDKATFEGIFRVEKGMYALSNGVLVDRHDIGDKTQFHWKLDTPQVSYLTTVAVSKYEVIEDRWRDIPLLYVVPPGTDHETVTRAFGLTPDMMEFMSQYSGIDFPFKKYGQVVVQNFIYGGMENTTATVMNSRMLYDEHMAATDTEQGLVAHELAHSWWGDMVTCNEWSQIWLNEGFATYFQSLYREHHDGDDAFRYQMDSRHRDVVVRDNKDARPIVVDFYNRKDSRNSANVYIKGASVLHMLRFLVGDEMFAASWRAYGQQHKYGLAETSDYVRAVKETTGENVDWFFEQWVYLAGHPKLKAVKSWDPDSGMLKLTVSQTQSVEGLVPLFRLPMDIEITCAEKTESYRIVVEAETQDFYFNLPSQPLMVILDKGDWTLKELQFDKTVDELLYQLANGDMMARVDAARSLAIATVRDTTVSALGDVLLNDGFWGVRREAALALGAMNTAKTKAVLIEALNMQDAKVRMAAAEALGKTTSSPDMDSALLKTFHDDYAYQVRAAAVKSLVESKSKGAQKACTEALKVDSDRNVIRKAGLDGLVELKASDDLRLVKPLAKPGNLRTVRHTAIASYAKLAKRLDSERERQQAAEFLAGMLDDWYLRTRKQVIVSLGVLGDESAVEPLRRVGRTDPVEHLRELANKTADAIEARQQVIVETEGLQTELDALGTKLESLRSAVQQLESRVPPKPAAPERTSSARRDS